jgi:4-hydroxy-3-polyprenylbenzoate decarboxylase
MEDCYLAKATERIFLPLLQTVFPEIRDYWLPWEGVFHNIVIVSIDKEYPGHAQRIMSGLWGQGQMSFCKAIVVVDKEINPQCAEDVLQKFLTHFDPASDITITKGVLDVLDHSSPFPNFGHKIGIDLTERCKGEPPRTIVRMNNDSSLQMLNIIDKIPGVTSYRQLFPELSAQHINRILILAVEKSDNRGGKYFAEAIFAQPDLKHFNIVILYDKDIDLHNNSLVLWKLFNNVDPGRDVIMRGNQMGIDACRKGIMDGHDREWPDDLRWDE